MVDMFYRKRKGYTSLGLVIFLPRTRLKKSEERNGFGVLFWFFALLFLCV